MTSTSHIEYQSRQRLRLLIAPRPIQRLGRLVIAACTLLVLSHAFALGQSNTGRLPWIVIQQNLSDFSGTADRILADFETKAQASAYRDRVSKQDKNWSRWSYMVSQREGFAKRPTVQPSPEEQATIQQRGRLKDEEERMNLERLRLEREVKAIDALDRAIAEKGIEYNDASPEVREKLFQELQQLMDRRNGKAGQVDSGIDRLDQRTQQFKRDEQRLLQTEGLLGIVDNRPIDGYTAPVVRVRANDRRPSPVQSGERRSTATKVADELKLTRSKWRNCDGTGRIIRDEAYSELEFLPGQRWAESLSYADDSSRFIDQSGKWTVAQGDLNLVRADGKLAFSFTLRGDLLLNSVDKLPSFKRIK